MGKFESCCQCDENTGRADRGEDSLYTEEGDVGPYCATCWDDAEYWQSFAGELISSLRSAGERRKEQNDE